MLGSNKDTNNTFCYRLFLFFFCSVRKQIHSHSVTHCSNEHRHFFLCVLFSTFRTVNIVSTILQMSPNVPISFHHNQKKQWSKGCFMLWRVYKGWGNSFQTRNALATLSLENLVFSTFPTEKQQGKTTRLQIGRGLGCESHLTNTSVEHKSEKAVNSGLNPPLLYFLKKVSNAHSSACLLMLVHAHTYQYVHTLVPLHTPHTPPTRPFAHTH